MGLALHAGTNSFLSPAPHRIRITIPGVELGHQPVPLIHPSALRPRFQSPPQGAIVLEVVFSANFFIPWPAAIKTRVQCRLVPIQCLVPCPGAGNLIPGLSPNQGTRKQRNSRTDEDPCMVQATRTLTVGYVGEVPLTSGLQAAPETPDGETIVRGEGAGMKTAGGVITTGINRNLIRCLRVSKPPHPPPVRSCYAIIDWNPVSRIALLLRAIVFSCPLHVTRCNPITFMILCSVVLLQLG